MPVFTESASSTRDLRVLPSFAPPLPRLSSLHPDLVDEDKYEVVVVGAGPAGLMLTLLLARYGLSDQSLLCLDAKPSTLKSGQADGVQPRTLEVFKSLGLADEIVNEACQMWEFAFWNPSPDAKKIIERTAVVPEVLAPARYGFEGTIHQGRIERILDEDLGRYSKRGIRRDSRVVKVEIDESDSAFPVVAEVECGGETRKIRSKYLIAADGAHSVVRQCLGLRLEGESLDHIWGVVDLVVDTDFPDIRRRCAVHSPRGSVMVIPRERISTGEYLTRLYVHVPDEDTESNARTRRGKVTLEAILQQATDVFRSYRFRPKTNGAIDWWAAYQIGQRVARDFIVRDNAGRGRVFLAGDACHTHSPKAGQGMNVSMMDSYNLAWKLGYAVHGLASSSALLDTYNDERQINAQNLIDFDRHFSTLFSGKEDASSGLTPEQLHNAFTTGNGFTNLLSTGRFRIICLTSTDLLDDGVSSRTLLSIGKLIHEYPPSLIEEIVIHPHLQREFEWSDIPECVKQEAEMCFYSGYELEDVYGIYGVDPEKGAIVVVRPDGVVGMVTELGDIEAVYSYLAGCVSLI
ncbi:hypothetical protein MW887_006258 [Aspergillus wentii]|nr:hypothetical protein MW887_006258 [Aspergillus wentii]